MRRALTKVCAAAGLGDYLAPERGDESGSSEEEAGGAGGLFDDDSDW